MPLKIRISNLNRKRKIDPKSAKRVAEFILRKNKIENALIDITFISDKMIKALNKKYMKKSNSTDVLSFLLERDSITPKEKIIGDLYISTDTAYKNAKRFGASFRSESVLYVIHGLLHLLGLGDKTASEKKKIRKLEKNFLEGFIRT